MTKEEALKAFRSYEIWDLMDNFTTDELQEMIDAIVSTPSLPSNLDEAANTFGFKETLERLRESGITRKNEGMFRWQIEKAFKAGAEWMAGQGGTVTEAYVVELNKDKGLNWLQMPGKQLCDALKKFNIGDEVVVQIRKK